MATTGASQPIAWPAKEAMHRVTGHNVEVAMHPPKAANSHQKHNEQNTESPRKSDQPACQQSQPLPRRTPISGIIVCIKVIAAGSVNKPVHALRCLDSGHSAILAFPSIHPDNTVAWIRT